MKVMGSRSKASAAASTSARGSPSSDLPTYWCIMARSSRVAFTSNEPQSVGTPCAARSTDSCESSVVLPAPVGPVSTVSSPLRWPFTSACSDGSTLIGSPESASRSVTSCTTAERRSRNVTTCVWGSGFAASRLAARSPPVRSASLASLAALAALAPPAVDAGSRSAPGSAVLTPSGRRCPGTCGAPSDVRTRKDLAVPSLRAIICAPSQPGPSSSIHR
mmetsp:Transcript_18643/g.70811  ORF Transcript_18643/g.70811 Transcript_18643/m.70811 type:complete len:219 (+) Transcript_18643:1520-2176(+)